MRIHNLNAAEQVSAQDGNALPRPVESISAGDVIAIPMVGGLHHRYSRTFRSAA